MSVVDAKNDIINQSFNTYMENLSEYAFPRKRVLSHQSVESGGLVFRDAELRFHPAEEMRYW